MSENRPDQKLKLDERHHAEVALLEQLAGLGWEILDLKAQQLPGESHRTNYTEVVMLPVLREQLKVINPWLEDDQVDEVVKQLTTNFLATSNPLSPACIPPKFVLHGLSSKSKFLAV